MNVITTTHLETNRMVFSEFLQYDSLSKLNFQTWK